MITEKEIEKIATLSRLKLTEEELKKFQKDISNILDYANKINEINTDSVDDTILERNDLYTLRADEVKESMERDKMLKNAKETQYGCFYVSKSVD